jgi:NAD(P)-dependent dehydrogenase (short-subunit alcohol dehydrogenase family)
MKLPDELIFIVNDRKPVKTTDARMDGKLCVITGATSGVGYEAAKRLAQGGADLVLVCRNGEKAARVSRELSTDYGATADVVLADFAKLAQVREAAGAILERIWRIDVLINNAGLHRTRRTLTEEGLEMVFCVNHLASFLLTRLLLDRLKSQRSIAHHPGQLRWTPLRGTERQRPQLESGDPIMACGATAHPRWRNCSRPGSWRSSSRAAV